MEKLFSGFNSTTAQEWKARLEKDLKGITFEQLSVVDRNGINIHPFYNNEDITSIPRPLTEQPDWSICSKIKVNNAHQANRAALEELNNGASGLCFVIEESVSVSELLQEIELSYIFTHFQLGANTLAFANELKEYCKSKSLDITMLNCTISYDFIHHFLNTASWPTDFEKGKQTFLAFVKNAEGLTNICINATLFQNAGANSSYELACTIAQVNDYLNILDVEGNIATITKIFIALPTDTLFFEQIAKLRALRNLLPLVFEPYGIQPDVHLHVETSNIYRSPFDSYSNLLRDSIAGMAAVIGGCNSLYIYPFDGTVADANQFSKRMSRNQQLIFKEESYLDKVADIAAGSYYLETLTEQIAQKAWEHFQEIESQGGLITAFEKGVIKFTVTQQAQQLIQEYKEGKRILIGVNKFVNANDEPKPMKTKDAATKGLGQLLLSEEII